MFTKLSCVCVEYIKWFLKSYFFFLAGLAGGSPIKNLTLFFLFSKNLFFSITSWWLVINRKKVLSSQKVLMWIYLQIRYLIWRYAELNPLLVGSGQIPLNIDLQQDDRTVCCGHNTVIGSKECFWMIYVLSIIWSNIVEICDFDVWQP